MQKLTKIVATIGPATDELSILKEMIASGMNVARFNTKHAEPEWHNERLKRVRQVAGEVGATVSTLLDLQGPEIRINIPGGKGFSVKKGDKAFFTSDKDFKGENFAIVPEEVIESLTLNNVILLEDGASEFIITNKSGQVLEAQALLDCEVNHRKTMNTPGVVMDMPSLTERDYQYLDGVSPKLVDWVGLSFVRNAQDIDTLRQELLKRKYAAGIVAKIENQEAVDNLDEIIAASDAVMVARGDLGVEVAYQELAYWQKTIIRKCRNAGIPVITATQMLKSMVDSPRPTRAEVSDVANAIYDGTDAIMLSEETTIGKYPVKAVFTQAEIAAFNEPHVRVDAPTEVDCKLEPMLAIAQAAIKLANNCTQVDKIVSFTETGRTVRLLSSYRTQTPIVAVTSNELVRNQMSLYFGVEAHSLQLKTKSMENESDLVEALKEAGIVKTGENIMLIHGKQLQTPGTTNTISLQLVV